MDNGTRLLLRLLGVRNGLWLWVLDHIHSSFYHVRLDGDGNGADLGHAVLGGVLRVLIQNTLALVRLRPVFGEETVADPFIPRSSERLGEDTTLARRLIFLH